jgi:hypothetical protein
MPVEICHNPWTMEVLHEAEEKHNLHEWEHEKGINRWLASQRHPDVLHDADGNQIDDFAATGTDPLAFSRLNAADL